MATRFSFVMKSHSDYGLLPRKKQLIAQNMFVLFALKSYAAEYDFEWNGAKCNASITWIMRQFHQQQWYLIWGIDKFLSHMSKYVNYLCHANVKEWYRL